MHAVATSRAIALARTTAKITSLQGALFKQPALSRAQLPVCAFSSSSKPPSADVGGVLSKVEKYSRFQPSPLSIQHLTDFGRTASIESSFVFLKHELPVRLANIMKELQLLPSELKETPGCKTVSSWYTQSFSDLVKFEYADHKDPQVQADFTSTLSRIYERHKEVVTTMAGAVLEVKNNYLQQSALSKGGSGKLPKFERSIQYFLDRLYTSRISTRMLINQHILLFGGKHDAAKIDIVGSIDPECPILPIVDEAYENARLLADQYYMMSPELIVRSHDATDEAAIPYRENEEGDLRTPIKCVYVPSHLYHILFELFKNAMRATIEHHEEAYNKGGQLPPIKVLVVRSKEDLTIRIRDRGGGIPRRLKSRIFQYLYTTAPNPVMSMDGSASDDFQLGQQGVPLAGYGYGLPLSRLYARYFAGDLEVHSCDGYGTDAVIYLQALADMAKEVLPIYHETGSKKIYEAHLAASDWTVAVSSSGKAVLDKAKGTGGEKEKEQTTPPPREEL